MCQKNFLFFVTLALCFICWSILNFWNLFLDFCFVDHLLIFCHTVWISVIISIYIRWNWFNFSNHLNVSCNFKWLSLFNFSDACLAKGTKRKLSQRTLFQFNFFSNKSNCKGTTESETDDKDISNSTNKLSSDGYEEDDNGEAQVHPLDSVALGRKRSSVSGEDKTNGNELNNQVDSASLSLEGRVFDDEMEASVANDELSNISLETFIVGRRFADETVLNLGAKIFLLRDAKNTKDANAVKVIPITQLDLLFRFLVCLSLLIFHPRSFWQILDVVTCLVLFLGR